MIKKYLLVILCTCMSLDVALGNDPMHTGLYFSSHEVNQDLRTSLNLTPKAPFEFKESFGMEFEASFRPGDGYFGYVFRIIADHFDNIDLVVNLNSSRTNFWLVHQEKTLISLSWDDIGGQNYNSWIPIKLIIDPKNELISLEVNGKQVSSPFGKDNSEYQFYEVVYGVNEIADFVSTDVAPMKVRNIALFEPKGKIRAFWKLDKHQNHLVYDENEGILAEVTNPVWEINRHVNWRKVLEFSTTDLLGSVMNTEGPTLYFLGSSDLQIVNLQNNSIQKFPYVKGNPYNCRSNSFVFDPEGNRIISYSFEAPTPSVLNLTTLEWSHSPLPCDLPRYWHHNKRLQDNKVVTFGGYGLFSYKSDLQQLDLTMNTWSVTPLNESIEPRYLTAMGQIGLNDWYVFGGYGTKSGAQQSAPRNYYDLYKINLESGTAEKIWDLQKDFTSHFVPADHLIPTPDKDGFFTLIYDHSQFTTSLNLAKIYLEDNRIEIYENAIPYTFRDTDSWTNLYLLPGQQQLLTVTNYQGKIGLHELAFPPLLPAETLQVRPLKRNEKNWIYLAGAIAAGMLVVLLYRGITKRSKRQVEKSTSRAVTGVSLQIDSIHIRQSTSALYFLGGFQAFDKEGKNITSKFTPTIRQLFLLIYFYAARGQKGITSVKLKEYIWPDKSDVSAKNNRNVNISKLRILLEKIGYFQVNNDDSYWKITFDKSVYTDYDECLDLLGQLKKDQPISNGTIVRLIQLLSYGELCPNVQNEWIDPIKVYFANITIDSLFVLIEKGIIEEFNYQLLLGVAETLLVHDVLNEEALKIKCNALFRMGKKGLAVQAYEKFAKEYEKMMGIPYDTPIMEFFES